jgi:hypothetical protein
MDILALTTNLGLDANTALIVYCLYELKGQKKDAQSIERRVRVLEGKPVIK